MSEKIGYNDGIAAFVAWARRIDPTAVYRPVSERPAELAKWSWLEKWERRERILKDTHDAAIAEPPPPPPPPPPPAGFVAPQTYNRGSSGQDARYCTNGLPRNSTGRAYEPSNPNIQYDDGGRCLGGRTGSNVDGLKPADQMDSREPCDPYQNGNLSFPPWPAASYQQ